jgi:hypothetical protein
MLRSFRAAGHRPAALALGLSLAAVAIAFNSARAEHNPSHSKDGGGVVRASVENGSAATGQFAGPKADRGTATLRHADGKRVLTWSDDFKIPDTPAPHWQVVDSSGNTYLLKRLVIKGDKQNRTIEVPAYVKDVAKVQIWCAYAEVLLGEAPFASPVK